MVIGLRCKQCFVYIVFIVYKIFGVNFRRFLFDLWEVFSMEVFRLVIFVIFGL